MLIREKFKRRLCEKPPSAAAFAFQKHRQAAGVLHRRLELRDAAGQRAVGSDYFFKVLRLVRFPGKCLNQIGDIEIFLVDQRHLIFCFQLVPRQIVNRTGADFDARIFLAQLVEILTRQGARQIQLRGDIPGRQPFQLRQTVDPGLVFQPDKNFLFCFIHPIHLVQIG